MTYGEPLCIITLPNTEQSLQRVISGNDESGHICKKLTANVEEDEEEIGCDKAKECINLRNRGLLLQIVQSWILGELGRLAQIYIVKKGLVSSAHGSKSTYLLVDVGDVMLSFILERRHVCGSCKACCECCDGL